MIKINKKYWYLLFLGIAIMLIISISYALLTKDIVGSSNKVIYKVGDLDVKLDDSSSKDISLTNAIPQEDSEGLSSEPYSFLLINNGTTDLKYTIYLEDDKEAKNKCGTDCELVPYKFIRYNLASDSESLKTSNLSTTSNALYTGTIKSKATDKFNLRVWLSIDADNTAMNKYYFGKIKVVVGQGDSYCKDNGFNTLSDCMLVMNNHESSVDIAKTNIKAKGIPDFSKTATTDEGLYKAEDDEGDSYYYRGAVKNNYVSFAGYTWRIIRRNGDGSIRMIYSGSTTSDVGESTSIGKSTFNEKYWDPTYIGYMYNENFSLHENNETTEYKWFTNTQKYNFGTGYTFDETTKKFTLTGTIKQLTWKDNHEEIVSGNLYSCLNTSCNVVYRITKYQSDTRMTVQPISYSSDSYEYTIINNTDSHMKNTIDTWYRNNLINYTSYLADEIFCNDRRINYGLGYLIVPTTTYGAYGRLYEKKTPSLKCTQDNDKFRISNELAKLDYPIALITADEVAIAGGVWNVPNSNYYLYSGKYFWTMSPSDFEASYSDVRVWRVAPSGYLNLANNVTSSFGTRPVINLRSDVQITKGDGTVLNPYVIQS